MPLEPKDRDKLEKLLNMLGSDFEGERANAGGMIKKMADRYNVTPAALCLDNRIGSASPAFEDVGRRRGYRDPGAWGSARRGGYGFADFDFNQDEAAERTRRQAEENQRRQQEQQRQRDEFHRRREEEIREAARKAAQQRQQEEARRKRRYFPGSYFGLLARLKGLYDAKFDTLPDYARDFIETVLDSCRADRMMSTKQRDLGRALLKEFEQQEDPFI